MAVSIKNPLPGHQYGRSEPGYWYPRDDTPPRRRPRLGWNPRTTRRVLGWLLVLVVVAAAFDASRAQPNSTVLGSRVTYQLQPFPGLRTADPTRALPATSSVHSSSAPTVPVPTGYAGAQAGDQPAAANGSVTIHGVSVTVAQWVRMTIDGGQRALCMTASLANQTGSEIGYSTQSWSLQSPSGDVHPPEVTVYDLGTPQGQPPSLEFGQLIASGSASGRLCFPDPSLSGTYVASFRPDLATSGRAVWLVREN